MDFDLTKPVPATQPWSQAFWDGTRAGKLLIQSCAGCGARIFAPRKRCPECWSTDLGWIESAGRGTIYTFSTAYSMVEPKFADELPYTIAYVDLDEGVRLMTRIVGCDPAAITIGMPVQVTFTDRDNFRLPYFQPVTTDA